MAQGKKSFLIYADIIEAIDHLTNEEKGILFQHILEYVNDLNPVLEDRVLLSAWKPIEIQLKRDLEKWKGKQKQRSEAGKRSAESRRTKSTTVNARSNRSTNSTVNVNVNDNVSVNDNVNNNIINTHRNSVEERKLKFAATINDYLGVYDNQMLTDFYEYWTEPTKSGLKFRQELEKTWALERRLKTWAKNNEKMSPKTQNFPKKKRLTLEEKMKKDYGIK